MIKLLAFDIDNTLADLNRPILPETIQSLKNFEKKGIKIAFVSGKPAIYISGMVRQLGLDQPIIIGENGLTIFYGSQVPPMSSIEAVIDVPMQEQLFGIRRNIFEELGDAVWFQPNAVCVTAFPKRPETMPKLRALVEKLFLQNELEDMLVFYQHVDSIDIAPKQVNKGNAMKVLLNKEGWKKEEVIAIGDGENDVPMFENAGFTVGVRFKGAYPVDTNVDSIIEAMKVIEKRTLV